MTSRPTFKTPSLAGESLAFPTSGPTRCVFYKIMKIVGKRGEASWVQSTEMKPQRIISTMRIDITGIHAAAVRRFKDELEVPRFFLVR